MKKTLLLWLFGLLLTTQVFAQNRSLSGTVKDATTGEALIGVNVTGKGTTIGTVTDIDGKYTLELPKDVTTLVFSYIGYTNLEKPILSLVIDASMAVEGKQLEELVVTAMAIKRESRSITGSFNTVTSEDFNSGSTNAIGAIQSKVPGLRINTIGGQVGASTRIVLRGEASLTGGNNALIVVDGIPINNNTNSYGNSGSDFVDFGNRANDINPDDIESVTVLKGPAATALYGSRGTAGVIIYTTKSGKGLKDNKKFNITASSGVTFDKVYLLMKRQDQFGQGYDNGPDPIENFSWGPKFDGVVRPWTPAVSTPNGFSQLIRPYSAVKHQLEDAFNTGTTVTSNLALEGGNDKFTYYVSYGNIRNKGIFPNTFYRRNNITANASAKLGDKVTTKFNLAYSNINQRTIQGQALGGGFVGPYQILIQTPVNIPLSEVRDYNSIYQDFNGYYGGYTPNPFWLMDNTNNDNKTDNVLGSVELEYKPVSYISLMARAGTNFTTSNSYISRPKYKYAIGGANPTDADKYTEQVNRRNDITLDITAAFNKEIVKNVNLSVLAGYNFYDRKTNDIFGETRGGLVVPGFYHLSNSIGQALAVNDIDHYRLIGLYGNINIGWKNMLFAEYSARNDWSSTLPKGNRGFFYNGGGLSFIPTELIKNESKAKDWINYVKIRGSVGTQGKDAGTYQLQSVFVSNPQLSTTNLGVQFPFNGVNGYTQGNRIGNPGLKPELTLLWEAGADLDILKDYLHVEYTYYQRFSKNLIVIVSLPSSSGYTSQVKNVGQINNKGHELLVRLNALHSRNNDKGLNWNLRVQFAKNTSKVVKVSDESEELNLNTGTVQVVLKEGLPYGTFKAYDYTRDSIGRIVVDATGAPSASSQFSYYGSYQPKYTLGLGTTFSWKGLSFDIQFDVKKGGIFYSGSREAGTFNGTTLNTLTNDRNPYIIPNSVVKNPDGTYSPNMTPLTNLFNYEGNVANDVTAQNLIDASYIKLREVSLSYSLDKKFFKKVPIEGITFSLIGRNLKFWLPTENQYADPEANSFGYAGNVQGLEFGSVPNTRSVGFDVKFKF